MPTCKLYLWRKENVSELILFLVQNVQNMDWLMSLELKIELTPSTHIPGAYIETTYKLEVNINTRGAFAYLYTTIYQNRDQYPDTVLIIAGIAKTKT